MQPLKKIAEAAAQSKMPKKVKQSQILKFKKRKSNKVSMTYAATGLDQENCVPHLLNLANGGAATSQTGDLRARRVSKVPFKVLDAPQLQDDFYLNLVDWSATNVLAVGLLGAVYIWSAETNAV